MLSNWANRRSNKSLALLAVSSLALSACQQGQSATTNEQPLAAITTTDGKTAPCPTNVYWGDTHLHTINSIDAVFKGVRLTPEDALRFGRGDAVTTTTGQKAKLNRPLDFMLVSDHSELIGVGAEIMHGNETLMKDETLKRWNGMMNESIKGADRAGNELISGYSRGTLPDRMRNPFVAGQMIMSAWKSYVDVTERYNDPGTFTTFIGYEYTLMPKGNNLHRVVIFKDGKDVVGSTLPFTAVQGNDVEDLWKWMDGYTVKTGGDILAIPHNGNLSNGMMFAETTMSGNPFTKDYAETRAKWEPLVEATQIKGDSESHPLLSPDDEFADYGKSGWDVGNLDLSSPKTPDMLPGDYARSALKRGLLLEAKLGVNPYKFGMIGSTDSHTGLATAEEDNYYGKFPIDEPRKNRASNGIGIGNDEAEDEPHGHDRIGWQYLAGGYAGVWAAQNNRDSIFNAMRAKEVYATTGPRITMRMFAGYDFNQSDLGKNPCDLYKKAVPMGSDLPEHKGKAPQILVTAQKDPESANLDRIQIVKGWVDGQGNAQEKIYDIAWSEPEKRKIMANGKLTPVGDTVDIANATWEDSIGAVELKTIWKDPDFKPDQRAFYYVRALEIPTPRWPVYDAKKYGTDLPKDAILKQQERIYGSPVWYTPKAKG